jgi:hypothetical protein
MLVGDLAVEEGHEPLAAVDQADPHAEGREDRRVLDAHRAAADDDERGREPGQAEDRVRIVDIRVIEGHVIGTVGTRAGRHEHDVGGQSPLGAVRHRHIDRRACAEARRPRHELDAMALEVEADRLARQPGDGGGAGAEPVEGELRA